jgi:H+/Cl- antiporter ClcA
MASFFAGIASAPIGAMLMVAEMTGGYARLPALMLVSVLANDGLSRDSRTCRSDRRPGK